MADNEFTQVRRVTKPAEVKEKSEVSKQNDIKDKVVSQQNEVTKRNDSVYRRKELARVDGRQNEQLRSEEPIQRRNGESQSTQKESDNQRGVLDVASEQRKMKDDGYVCAAHSSFGLRRNERTFNLSSSASEKRMCHESSFGLRKNERLFNPSSLDSEKRSHERVVDPETNFTSTSIGHCKRTSESQMIGRKGEEPRSNAEVPKHRNVQMSMQGQRFELPPPRVPTLLKITDQGFSITDIGDRPQVETLRRDDLVNSTKCGEFRTDTEKLKLKEAKETVDKVVMNIVGVNGANDCEAKNKDFIAITGDASRDEEEEKEEYLKEQMELWLNKITEIIKRMHPESLVAMSFRT